MLEKKLPEPMKQMQWHLVSATIAAGISISLIFMYSRRLYKKRSRSEDEEQREKKEAKCVENNVHHFDDSYSIHHSQHHLPSHLQRELLKEQRRHLKIPDLARNSPMYDNIQMMDPEGRLLASISLKKAQWYVHKQLARWRALDSSIQLLFKPKAHSGQDYEKTMKPNMCVGCGSDEFHMRHYVVPYAYRTLLPKRFKTHLSHDVVILCPDCHLHCEYETHLRMKSSEDLRPEECQSANYVDKQLHRVRSAALALLRWKHKLPSQKIDEYNQLIRAFLNLSSDKKELSARQLQEAVDVKHRIPNPNYIPGPEFVIGSLKNNDVLIEKFIKEWRQHFVDTVQPKFLSKGWSVDAPVMSNIQDDSES